MTRLETLLTPEVTVSYIYLTALGQHHAFSMYIAEYTKSYMVSI